MNLQVRVSPRTAVEFCRAADGWIRTHANYPWLAVMGTPGVLPCRLLDHGTGYLAVAGALDGLRI